MMERFNSMRSSMTSHSNAASFRMSTTNNISNGHCTTTNAHLHHHHHHHHHNAMHVQLTVGELEQLLLQCASICETPDDRAYCEFALHTLHTTSNPNKLLKQRHCEFMDEVAVFLASLLSASTPKSAAADPLLIAAMHSCLGMIQRRQGLYTRALRSLLHALWIHEKAAASTSSSSSTGEEHPTIMALAITEHRLGLVYAHTGDYSKATYLLEQALEIYHKQYSSKSTLMSSLRHIHPPPCIADAERALAKLQSRKQQSPHQHPMGADPSSSSSSQGLLLLDQSSSSIGFMDDSSKSSLGGPALEHSRRRQSSNDKQQQQGLTSPQA